MKLRKTLAAGLVAVAAMTMSACGINSDPLAGVSAQPVGDGSAPVIVGSANFTESQILAELYTQAMQAKGVAASTRLNIGAREVYIKALQDGSISVIPEYTGNLLLYFDKAATATTAGELEKSLPAAVGDLKIGAVSPAANQDVYVVTKAFSDANGITSLADLKKISTAAVIGGPAELRDRPYGPEGLKSIYGATFKEFTPYASPAVKVKDLNDDKIQVASFFSTESAIVDNGYVMLKDPQSMILPQNIVPLMTTVVAGNPTAADAIAAVQAALTTEELTALNKQVDVERDDPSRVAQAWLASKGLL